VSIMKTLSRTLGFVALAVIAIVAVLTFRAFAQPTPTATHAHKTFKLNFGGPGKDNYAEVDQEALDTALRTLGRDQYKIRFLAKVGDTPIEDYHPSGQASIKTDKVTTSEVAKNAPAEESLAYDPKAVYHVQSNSTTDIKAVLDAFTVPSPTPTP
jgi:hypothetical protein